MKRLAIGLIVVLITISILVSGLLIMAQTNWFAQALARQASQALQRELRLAGALQIDWSLHPRIHVPELTLANAAWAGERPLLQLQSAELTLDLPALLRGQLAIRDLFLKQPQLVLVRSPDGRRNWDGLSGRQGEGGRFQLTLDAVRIDDGRLDYADASQALEMELAVHTDAAAQAIEQLQVSGRGSRHEKAFELNLHGGPLLSITDTTQPYPISGWLRADKTALEGKGTLLQPLAPQRGDFQLALQGPNPADLHELLGLTLPDLPPYRLNGRLVFEQGLWHFEPFSGTVGDSDLSGKLTIHPGEPLRLEAELHSDQLDLDDLLPMFGATPATGEGESASIEKRQQAQAEQQNQEVLPKAPPDRSRLLDVDATVHFLGKRVNAPRKIPLEQVAFALRLQQGILRFDPLDFGTGGGAIKSQLILDVRQRPVQGELAAHLENVDLGNLLRDFGVPEGGFGTIQGSLNSRFAGESVKQALASADGALMLYMTHGQVDAVLVSLAGLDAGRAIMEQIFGSGPTEIECALTYLLAKDGQAKVERFLVATKNIDLTAAGAADLGKEEFDIALRGYPRSPSIGASDAPVHLSGHFADAHVSILSAELLERGALAALAALLAPPLAILPFINPGSGDDQQDVCTGLLAEAKKIDTAASK